MPKRLILACVDNDALNGNYEKSSFKFKQFMVCRYAFTRCKVILTYLYEQYLLSLLL